MRYYMARWLVGEDRVPALAILEWTGKGWHGVTTFDPDSRSQLDKRRNGLLLYSRADDEALPDDDSEEGPQ